MDSGQVLMSSMMASSKDPLSSPFSEVEQWVASLPHSMHYDEDLGTLHEEEAPEGNPFS